MTDDFNEFFDDNTHWVEQGVRTNARGRAARTAEIPQGDGASDVHSAGRKRISGIIIAIAIVALLIGGGYFGVTKLIAWAR